MKVLEKDKLPVVILLLSLSILEVTSRSFRNAREGPVPGTLPHPDTPFSSTSVDNKPGTGRVWREDRMHKLVNVFENEFSVDEQKEMAHQHPREDEESGGLSAEEQEMIKKRILDGLGLATIPTRNLVGTFFLALWSIF